MNAKTLIMIVSFFLAVCLSFPLTSSIATELSSVAEMVEETKSYGIWRDLGDELSEGLEYSLRMLTFGTYQNAADSYQNPNNDFFHIPRYKAEFDLRPDIYLNFQRVALNVKPRMTFEWLQWEDGVRKGDTDWDDEWFINEWLARIRLTDNLFVSYGRENLQWGPSSLFSPSNPFFRDNGRSNPKRELSGMDFARLVWLQGMSWTLSLIANPDEGRQRFPFSEFDKTYALKVDYSGQEGYASLILSHKESDRNRLGGFAGWTASDALLLHGEGMIERGVNYLYPNTANHQFGAIMEAVYDDDSSLKSTVLVGGSYTFELGPVLSVEYVYNGPGYSDDQAEAYYRLRKEASEAFDVSGPIQSLSALALNQTANTRLRLLRRNYVMFQYSHHDIKNVLSLMFRWTQNIDDGSGQFISLVDYLVGDHIQLFFVGTLNSGGGNTEFGSILNHQLMIGLEYTF